MSVIAYNRMIGPVKLDVIVSEDHTSVIEITSNPIETGSEVNDHAYLAPKEVSFEIADGEAAATYQALVRFQESRVPFTLVTGLMLYRNMLIKRINAKRDKRTARILGGTVDMQEVIIVSTAYATGAFGQSDMPEGAGNTATRQAIPNSGIAGNASTADVVAGTVARGDSPVSTINAGSVTNQSILQSIF